MNATEGNLGTDCGAPLCLQHSNSQAAAQDIGELLGLNLTYPSADSVAGNVEKTLGDLRPSVPRETPSGAVQEEEEETEDEDEVVTPGEVTDFTMSSQQEKKKAPVDTRVVIAEASNEVEASCV